MMKYNPGIHHRRSTRLKDYDYSQAGAYFVTICTKDRECLLGEIIGGAMQLNEYGEITHNCLNNLPNHYSQVEMDTFVIMPNHVHTIIVIHSDVVGAGFKPALLNNHTYTETNRAGFKPAPTLKQHGLPEIIRAFKTFSSRGINKIRNVAGCPVWQRNYYERIIRNGAELNEIREYIINNPLNWDRDENYRIHHE